MFRVTETNENAFCVVSRDDKDYRRRFLEDKFHILLEEANKISVLLQQGMRSGAIYSLISVNVCNNELPQKNLEGLSIEKPSHEWKFIQITLKFKLKVLKFDLFISWVLVFL